MNPQPPPGPIATIIRHAQTSWNIEGLHTGSTDIPLTEVGVEQAKALRPTLERMEFDLVITSPMQRAKATCHYGGLGEQAEVWDDLREWEYGDYEGISTVEIWQDNPGWNIFQFGAPQGELPSEIADRADRVIQRIRDSVTGRVAVFSHGHFLRVLAARWIGLGPEGGMNFVLSSASISELGYERERPVFTQWNAVSHY